MASPRPRESAKVEKWSSVSWSSGMPRNLRRDDIIGQHDPDDGLLREKPGHQITGVKILGEMKRTRIFGRGDVPAEQSSRRIACCIKSQTDVNCCNGQSD